MVEEQYQFFNLIFRAFHRYLTDKNPTHGRGTVSVFQFSIQSFSMISNRQESNTWSRNSISFSI